MGGGLRDSGIWAVEHWVRKALAFCAVWGLRCTASGAACAGFTGLLRLSENRLI